MRRPSVPLLLAFVCIVTTHSAVAQNLSLPEEQLWSHAVSPMGIGLFEVCEIRCH